MTLTQRELWLIDRAFVAGAGSWNSVQEWLGSFRTRPGAMYAEPISQILEHEAPPAPPAPAPVDYANLPRPLPAGFGQGVAIERLLIGQGDANKLLTEIRDGIKQAVEQLVEINIGVDSVDQATRRPE